MTDDSLRDDEQEQEQQSEEDSGVPVNEKADNIRIFDYDKLLVEVEAKLKGCKLEVNPLTKTWRFKRIPGASRFMNESGVQECMAILRTSVNVLGAASIITENRILDKTKWFGIDLGCLIGEKMYDWALEESKADVVHRMICDAYELNLRKSQGGTLAKYALTAQRHITTEQLINNQNEQGFTAR